MISLVVSVIARTSQPSMSGAARMHHSVKWVRYSSTVQPPAATLPSPCMPTTSMSGSFQWPGPAYGWRSCCRSKPMSETEPQLSLMSPVVRHMCAPARVAPQSQGFIMPHSHMLNTMGRPVMRSAWPMRS